MAVKRVNGSETRPNHDKDESDGISGTVDPGNDDEVIYSAGKDERIPTVGIPTVEPSSIPFEPDGTTERKRRGRQPGSRNTNTKASKQKANDLTGILLSLHMMGATILKVPELELEQSEAQRLGEAINRVNELYNGFILTDKQAAWLGLLLACGQVYGPRFVAFNLREKNEKKKQPVTINAPQPKVM